MDVEDDVVVDCQPKQEPNETELLLRLEGGGVEPVESRDLVVGEETWSQRVGEREDIKPERGRYTHAREGGETMVKNELRTYMYMHTVLCLHTTYTKCMQELHVYMYNT